MAGLGLRLGLGLLTAIAAAEAAGAPINAVAPAISGTPNEGQTLSVSTGTWLANGATISGYSYQWQRDGVNIAGATGSSHVVVAADATKTITCEVTATNAAGSTMAEAGGVTGVGLPTNTVAPAITGNRWVGQTLTSTTGTWSANGATISGYTYQWRRGGSDISGATASTYVLVAADTGQSVTCQVTATNAVGPASASSNTAAICADQFWSSVVLMLGFEGPDGATSTTDEAIAPHSFTFNGNAQIDTAQFKFGASSLLLDGTGDYLQAADSADWHFSAAFTVEAWIRPASVSGIRAIISQFPNVLGERAWELCTSGSEILFRYTTDGTTIISLPTSDTSGPLTTGSWFHLCAERNAAGDLRLYINGVMAHKATGIGAFNNSTQSLRIGALDSGTNMFNGRIDEIRVTKGVARYDSDAGFTAPSAAYPRP